MKRGAANVNTCDVDGTYVMRIRRGLVAASASLCLVAGCARIASNPTTGLATATTLPFTTTRPSTTTAPPTSTRPVLVDGEHPTVAVLHKSIDPRPTDPPYVVSRLVLLDESTGAVRSQLYAAAPTLQIWGVAVAPDKRRVVFGLAPAWWRYRPASGCGERLMSIGLDGSPAREIGQGVDPAISPDGSKLAYATLATDNLNDCLARAVVVRDEASETERTFDFDSMITPKRPPSGIVQHMSWSPNGKLLAVEWWAGDESPWAVATIDLAAHTMSQVPLDAPTRAAVEAQLGKFTFVLLAGWRSNGSLLMYARCDCGYGGPPTPSISVVSDGVAAATPFDEEVTRFGRTVDPATYLAVDGNAALVGAVGGGNEVAIESAERRVDLGPVEAIAWPANLQYLP